MKQPINMTKKKKLLEIYYLVKNRYIQECEGHDEWCSCFDRILEQVEEELKSIIGKKAE